jgi:hypothetical protein
MLSMCPGKNGWSEFQKMADDCVDYISGDGRCSQKGTRRFDNLSGAAHRETNSARAQQPEQSPELPPVSWTVS